MLCAIRPHGLVTLEQEGLYRIGRGASAGVGVNLQPIEPRPAKSNFRIGSFASFVSSLRSALARNRTLGTARQIDFRTRAARNVACVIRAQSFSVLPTKALQRQRLLRRTTMARYCDGPRWHDTRTICTQVMRGGSLASTTGPTPSRKNSSKARIKAMATSA